MYIYIYVGNMLSMFYIWGWLPFVASESTGGVGTTLNR